MEIRPGFFLLCVRQSALEVVTQGAEVSFSRRVVGGSVHHLLGGAKEGPCDYVSSCRIRYIREENRREEKRREEKMREEETLQDTSSSISSSSSSSSRM